MFISKKRFQNFASTSSASRTKSRGVMGGRRSLRYSFNFCICPVYRKYGLHRNVCASRFNGPYGRQGCVLARNVESNQGGRFDGNESVADYFRSGAVSFKKHVHAISRGFFPSYICQKNLPSGKRTPCPGSTPRPLLSSQISTTLCKF
ncbi:hypothetical protein TNCV_4347791 [Trichonephila clavipes]|nr:hypothetical protein TNCV_4347791 [Trichonephila clavipes]